MTQEEKSLLMKDLCARLPYKPIVHAKWSYTEPDGRRNYNEADRELRVNDFYDIWHIKPYLRPMSSMTEEECKELGDLPATIENVGETLPNIPYYIEVARPEQLDWLNANHFDYRGLIEKGLALEAPEGMYV